VHIRHLNLRQITKFYSIIFKFDEFVSFYACSPREFSFSTTHVPKKTFDIWQQTKWLKCTNCSDITVTTTAKHIQLETWGRAQREATRHRKSNQREWGNYWGKIPLLATSHGLNTILLHYTAPAVWWVRFRQTNSVVSGPKFTNSFRLVQ